MGNIIDYVINTYVNLGLKYMYLQIYFKSKQIHVFLSKFLRNARLYIVKKEIEMAFCNQN